ncbi:helix-turn-helix domain-containing protein [Rhodopila sp.]|uniref:helix-turn-helix domain-containing protein n=1 Tax=Rhodopila sp. TaxID=2480087 RepID=UPI003D14EC8F
MLTPGLRFNAYFWVVHIGSRISAARREAGLSQRALATATRVSHGLVGAWESQKKLPGRENLVAIARVTGKPMSYFIENVVPDLAEMVLTNADEIEIVTLYRQLTPGQRISHLNLFRTSVAVRAEIEQQSSPAKGQRVTA